MQVDEQKILNASRELWTSYLGLTVQMGETQDDAKDDAQEEKIWSSCVKISGSWRGAILLECPESIARHAAAMLFAADSDEIAEDDIEAAVKELADLFGKKLRPHLPEATKISRPSIVEQQGECKAIVGMSGLSELKMNCEGRQVRIVLYQAEPDLAAAG